MRVIPVELDTETVAALEVERELLGFENRSAYIGWIVANRSTIDATERAGRAPLHEAYRERIAQLEERLEEAESTGLDPDPDVAEASTVVADRRHDGRDGDERGIDGSEWDDSDGWMPSRCDPTVEVRGTPRTTVWTARDAEDASDESRERESIPRTADADSNAGRQRRLDDDSDRARERDSDSDYDSDSDSILDSDPISGSNRDSDPESGRDEGAAGPGSSVGANESTEAAVERADGVISAMNLTPERVERIREDPIAEDAGVLGTVEVDRLDELSRRAVAKTRKRLDRDVQTGLEYTSSTSLADDVRLGEDVTDLEDISVPGRSDAVVDRRRELAGHAIAFLRDRGRARRSDFVEALYEDHPAGYETADGWWRCVKEALRQVDGVDGGEGARDWTFGR